MDRDRVAALIATLGTHPHASVMRGLLAETDRANGDRHALVADAAAANRRADRLQARLVDVEADAARLAAYIIAHPTDSDPTEVLNLHDRCQ